MKVFTIVFRCLLAAGALAHLAFGAVALVSPDALAMIVGLERVEFSYVWIGNLGMLDVPLVLMMVPAIADPMRYRAYAWLAILPQLGEGAAWYLVSRNPPNQVFRPFGVLLLALAAAQLVAVLLAEPPLRLNPADVRDVVADGRASRAERSPALVWFTRVA
jgi:hypothetical protein